MCNHICVCTQTLSPQFLSAPLLLYKPSSCRVRESGAQGPGRCCSARAVSCTPLQPHFHQLVTATGTQLPGATKPGSRAAEQTPLHGSRLQKTREKATIRENK